MDAKLKSLEDKMDLLVRLYQDTRRENASLRQLLKNEETKNHQLAERMNIAAERLQALLNNLPDE
jgi:hypothetical protein